MYYDLQEEKVFEIRDRKTDGGLMIHFLSFLSNNKKACEDHPGYIIEASR